MPEIVVEGVLDIRERHRGRGWDIILIPDTPHGKRKLMDIFEGLYKVGNGDGVVRVTVTVR